jgi:8-oxo-dGTP diphosphatase
MQPANYGAPSEPIRIAAAIIVDTEGCMLLVRKRGTRFFMQPGGKLETGESRLEALAREIREELGCVLQKAAFLGTFTAPAANESARSVEAALFHAEIAGEITLGAEIEELAWIRSHRETSLTLAPLTAIRVFPLLESRQFGQHSPAVVRQLDANKKRG